MNVDNGSAAAAAAAGAAAAAATTTTTTTTDDDDDNNNNNSNSVLSNSKPIHSVTFTMSRSKNNFQTQEQEPSVLSDVPNCILLV
jgi:hypothetical protein